MGSDDARARLAAYGAEVQLFVDLGERDGYMRVPRPLRGEVASRLVEVATAVLDLADRRESEGDSQVADQIRAIFTEKLDDPNSRASIRAREVRRW